MNSQTRPVSKRMLSFVELLTILATICVIYLFIGLTALLNFFSSSDYNQSVSLESDNNKSIVLTVPRGKNLKIESTFHSLGGFYSSEEGVNLVLRDDASGQSTTYVICKKEVRQWTNEISSSKSASENKFNTVIRLNQSMQIKSLEGSISGTLHYPQSSGLQQFEGQRLDVNIPVKIILLDKGEKPNVSSRFEQYALVFALDLGAIAIIVLTVVLRKKTNT